MVVGLGYAGGGRLVGWLMGRGGWEVGGWEGRGGGGRYSIGGEACSCRFEGGVVGGSSGGGVSIGV